MNQQEFTTVMQLPGNIRYEYLIKKVVDNEEIWGLFDDGWVETQDDEGNRMIPFWPRQEFASALAPRVSKECTPKSIDLYEFFDEWLPEMKRDGIRPSIFWNGTDSAVLEIDILRRDLELELEKY